MVESVSDITEEVRSFFEHRYKEPDPNRLALDGVQFSSLSSEGCSILEEHFSIEQLRLII